MVTCALPSHPTGLTVFKWRLIGMPETFAQKRAHRRTSWARTTRSHGILLISNAWCAIEEERFSKTLDKCLALLEEELKETLGGRVTFAR